MCLKKVAIINIKLEDKATENLRQIATKHIPFAVAKTLTQIVQQSQQEVRRSIKEKFFIRKKSGGFESSIRIKPATKTKLTAEVYTMAAFAALQQTGGIKKAKDGRLAIPSYQAINQVKKRSDSNSPSSYLAGDAFKIKTKSGAEAIAQRKGKELKILYFLRKSAQVDKKLDMIEITTNTVKDRFDAQLKGNVSEVLNQKVL
ncbi:MAG: hypothetical protein EBS06_08415 [Proteobacteria bacterium]|nr:hypothetical protein [Pseudomonadota bacterium]